MTRWVLGLVVAMVLVAAVAYTWGRSVGESEQWASGAGGGTAPDKTLIPDSLGRIRTGEPQDVRIRTTGYSYQDNTPRNSDKISGATIHRVAGGLGTYDDPITVAVPGHSGRGAQLPIGTRVYYKPFQFYGIVEDTGATKFSGTTHTDIWVDGRGFSASQAERCMDPVTKDSVQAILNPPPGLPTRQPGPITEGEHCNVGGS
jgi:hypothetical protein